MTTSLSICEYFRTLAITELANCDRPTVGTSYAGIGIVAWDDPCRGQLTVNPIRKYKSGEFPGEYFGPEECFDLLIAVEISMLLLRCVPTPNDRGVPPTAAALQAAHESVLTDGEVLWSTISDIELPDKEWEIARLEQSFGGGEGGAVGIETTFVIGVPEAQWTCGTCEPPDPLPPPD